MDIAKGKITRTQRCVLYGCEGVGKTTLASQFPNPLFVDLEGGSAHLDVNRVGGIVNWNALLNAIDELIQDTQGYKTLVIDTADWAEKLCAESLCEKYKKTGIEDFGYGKGYTYLAEEFAKFLNKLTQLQKCGMHVLILAHSQIKKIELPEESGAYDHYELKCSKQIAPLLREWSDGLLFANYRTYVQANAAGKGKAIGGKERVLYTEHTAFCDAKNRWGLADVLPMVWESLRGVFESEDTRQQKLPITENAKLKTLEGLMEMYAITETELNRYLRGANPKGRVFIGEEQSYRDLSGEILDALVEDKGWKRVESQIVEGRNA